MIRPKSCPATAPSRARRSLSTSARCWRARASVWQKLVAADKSLDDVYAAKPFADLDAKWAANEQAAKNFMRVVYYSLKK